jgi:hypothetical protein
MKRGDKYRVRIRERRPLRWNPDGRMDKYMGQTVTIRKYYNFSFVSIEEDQKDIYGGWNWYEEDFEPINGTRDPNYAFRRRKTCLT